MLLTLFPQQLVLVGDPNQLPALVRSSHVTPYSYQTSLFERLHHLHREDSTKLLDEQYRMHPDIARWPIKEFYSDKVTNGANVLNDSLYHFFEEKDGKNHPLMFFPHFWQRRSRFVNQQ
eukprot:Lithocolla_globosa_v1_NODE_11217_length_526_cov_1.985138.p1 type:complete len:119 gc:universal NODE_11217_length_526_cov_1.985138:458-102(-)